MADTDRSITDRLAELSRRPTRYEIVATSSTGVRLLVGYTMRKSRPGILAHMRDIGPEMIEVLDIGPDNVMRWERGAAVFEELGKPAWRVAFSGRTQRDAIINGELPWIGSRPCLRAAA